MRSGTTTDTIARLINGNEELCKGYAWTEEKVKILSEDIVTVNLKYMRIFISEREAQEYADQLITPLASLLRIEPHKMGKVFYTLQTHLEEKVGKRSDGYRIFIDLQKIQDLNPSILEKDEVDAAPSPSAPPAPPPPYAPDCEPMPQPKTDTTKDESKTTTPPSAPPMPLPMPPPYAPGHMQPQIDEHKSGPEKKTLPPNTTIFPLIFFKRKNRIFTLIFTWSNFAAFLLVSTILASFFFPGVAILKFIASIFSSAATETGLTQGMITGIASLISTLISSTVRYYIKKIWRDESMDKNQVLLIQTPKMKRTETTTLSLTKQFEESNKIDIAILIDATRSMQPYIDAARESIREIMSDITKKNPTADIKIAIVGFRDYSSENPTFSACEVRDFTTPEKARTFLEQLKATSETDNDIPETIELGLTIANETLSWRPNSIRSAYIIGNTEPHAAPHPDRDRYPTPYENPIERHYSEEANRLFKEKGIIVNSLFCKGWCDVYWLPETAKATYREMAIQSGGTFSEIEDKRINLKKPITDGITKSTEIHAKYSTGGEGALRDYHRRNGENEQRSAELSKNYVRAYRQI